MNVLSTFTTHCFPVNDTITQTYGIYVYIYVVEEYRSSQVFNFTIIYNVFCFSLISDASRDFSLGLPLQTSTRKVALILKGRGLERMSYLDEFKNANRIL